MKVNWTSLLGDIGAIGAALSAAAGAPKWLTGLGVGITLLVHLISSLMAARKV